MAHAEDPAQEAKIGQGGSTQARGRRPQPNAAAFNARDLDFQRRGYQALNEEAKALAREGSRARRRQALELTVDELTQGIDLALENMAAGMTQSEAVRLAAEDIRKQKQDIPF